MPQGSDCSEFELGYDIPARLGFTETQIQTPSLVLDLDAFEANLVKMAGYARAANMALRVHAKMHKSLDVAHAQIAIGGACGICCQKLSEAEVFARGGIKDILISNQIRDPLKIDRLAQLPRFGANISVCIDDIENVAEVAAAVALYGYEIGCLVELDVGAGRCGVKTPADCVSIAKAIHASPNLRFVGLQAYNGAAQHIRDFDQRGRVMAGVIARVKEAVAALTAAGLPPATVTGAGTGSWYFEAGSNIYTELQCGSYAFMDADYGRIHGPDHQPLAGGEWQNALYILTSIMSRPSPELAICDAGLKVQSVDSGLPEIAGFADLDYIRCSDEHGVISDPKAQLRINDKLRLIPGHCDPTCNIHDWYVGVRGGIVECLWPVSARGRSW